MMIARAPGLPRDGSDVYTERGISNPGFRARGGTLAPSPLFVLPAEHERPTNGLGVFEEASLDGFVFGGGGHGSKQSARRDS